MVQQLLPLLPQEIGQAALYAAMFGTLLGAGLWLVGARFSRPMMTLVAVSIGAMVGRMVPGWMGWNVNSMAASVGGAVVLGMSAFVLHRVWVGVGLGVLLACWAALVTWITSNGGAEWAWPAVDATTTLASFGQSVWEGLPDKVRTILPYASGGAALSGFLAALLWPRVAVVMLYSALGASLLVGMGLTAIENGRPEWMRIVPAQTWAQVAALGGIVLFGAIVQWQLSPKPRASAPTEAEPKAEN
ncbi:MAG: hypothetical protein WBD40_06565 [Tepidisphaeraceae bacterium]